EPGVVMGTAIYMSPEQARGMQLDSRTDIFSFGVVLYKMVTARLPFDGATSSEVVASILSEKAPPPLARYSREAPAELERIVSKALRKERTQRYQTGTGLQLATVYAGLGDKDHAFAWLEKDFQQHTSGLLWIVWWMPFEDLHS